MEHLISMFIDNELSLDEKMLFIHMIRSDKNVADETVSLLGQEKILRGDPVYDVPCLEFEPSHGWKQLLVSIARPFGFAACGFAAAMLLFFSLASAPLNREFRNRFVIYRPDTANVKIAGTFSKWKPLPMKKIGNSGYWEIILELPEGEYRYTYILEGRDRFADPTVLMRELDDYGGENTIIEVKENA